eukprot:9349175-Prorocentrum_lima.AAC.1
MTSSLVGSEMCIRDREREQALRQAACGAVDAMRRVHVLKLLGLLGRAVSYTHLTLPTICSV